MGSDFNFDIYIDQWTDIFYKWSNLVQDISKHENPLKTGCRKLSLIQYFLLMFIEESKNMQLTKCGECTLYTSCYFFFFNF